MTLCKKGKNGLFALSIHLNCVLSSYVFQLISKIFKSEN